MPGNGPLTIIIIDDDLIFLNYIKEGSFIFADNFSDILFFSKVHTYKSETVECGIRVRSKLDTYSIEKNKYINIQGEVPSSTIVSEAYACFLVTLL